MIKSNGFVFIHFTKENLAEGPYEQYHNNREEGSNNKKLRDRQYSNKKKYADLIMTRFWYHFR